MRDFFKERIRKDYFKIKKIIFDSIVANGQFEMRRSVRRKDVLRCVYSFFISYVNLNNDDPIVNAWNAYHYLSWKYPNDEENIENICYKERRRKEIFDELQRKIKND